MEIQLIRDFPFRTEVNSTPLSRTTVPRSKYKLKEKENLTPYQNSHANTRTVNLYNRKNREGNYHKNKFHSQSDAVSKNPK